MKTLKAIGSQGSWFAKVDNSSYPCVWRRWLTGMHYCDPGYEDTTKWREYSDAIAAGKTVMLANEEIDRSGRWNRVGYVAMFTISNMQLAKNTLEFDLVDRIANLK